MGHTYKIFKMKKVDKRQRNINIQWSMLWIIILLTDRNKGNPYRFQTGDTFFSCASHLPPRTPTQSSPFFTTRWQRKYAKSSGNLSCYAVKPPSGQRES